MNQFRALLTNPVAAPRRGDEEHDVECPLCAWEQPQLLPLVGAMRNA